jgi:anti-anti-sigma factor
MEIATTQKGEWFELRLHGRLDGYWADHLNKNIEEAIRAGKHQIELNFSQVDYLSSAGLRVLLRYHKELKAVQGSLRITEPSERAHSILKMAGLAGVMVFAPKPASLSAAAKTATHTVEKAAAVFQVFDQSPGAQIRCSLLGAPGKFFNGGFQDADCASVQFPGGTFGLGLGAFGNGFQDCRERFGEFLGTGGMAVTLPTDGSTMPDFVITAEALVPEVKVLYGVRADGSFAQMIRFDCKPEPPGVISLGGLVEATMEISGTPAAGLVILAEATGMVGAALRRSPGRSDAQAPLAFPGVRDWLSFTTERTSDRNLVLIVGIAVQQPRPAVEAFVRPLAQASTVQGHFHAALFPYRPVQRGELHLEQAVAGLMAADTAQTLLHLLNDEREFEGVGQSEFVRGACWIGPISHFEAKGKSAT